jgi:hypothetical protein
LPVDALYRASARPYGPRRFDFTHNEKGNKTAMRAETEKLVDEIKQAISLLRRHL